MLDLIGKCIEVMLALNLNVKAECSFVLLYTKYVISALRVERNFALLLSSVVEQTQLLVNILTYY
jgi:hypothetical protein